MSWVYFDAEKHGLEVVTSVDWLAGTGCYEWCETTILYSKAEKLFYWETGSGCSCDGPLDNVNSLEDLTKGSFFMLAAQLQQTLAGYAVTEDEDVKWREENLRSYGVLSMEVADAIAKCLSVRDADIDN